MWRKHQKSHFLNFGFLRFHCTCIRTCMHRNTVYVGLFFYTLLFIMWRTCTFWINVLKMVVSLKAKKKFKNWNLQTLKWQNFLFRQDGFSRFPWILGYVLLTALTFNLTFDPEGWPWPWQVNHQNMHLNEMHTHA